MARVLVMEGQPKRDNTLLVVVVVVARCFLLVRLGMDIGYYDEVSEQASAARKRASEASERSKRASERASEASKRASGSRERERSLKKSGANARNLSRVVRYT